MLQISLIKLYDESLLYCNRDIISGHLTAVNLAFIYTWNTQCYQPKPTYGKAHRGCNALSCRNLKIGRVCRFFVIFYRKLSARAMYMVHFVTLQRV